jgi:hypothetical protein
VTHPRHTSASLCLFLCCAALIAATLPLEASTSDSSPLGRWDLTISTGKVERASWIEIMKDQGQPTIRMVGISGHATRLATVEIKGTELRFVATREDQGFPEDVVFKGKLVRDQIEGLATTSAGEVWHWKATRAPDLKRSGPTQWAQPISLFDGKDLTGWKLRDPTKPGTWKAEAGLLITTGRGSDLVTTSSFEDFKLHIEFRSGPSSNSGVYLRGRYEIQIETDSAEEPPSHHTGGVYGFLDPVPEQPRKTDQWQSFDITLIGRNLTVVQNGITVIANQEIPGITGGALDSHEASPGPICLQGSEPGTVAYRNIVLTPAAR